ncbi:hypothetical protein H4R33_004521, partial [Dimargaris cristalligena]
DTKVLTMRRPEENPAQYNGHSSQANSHYNSPWKKNKYLNKHPSVAPTAHSTPSTKQVTLLKSSGPKVSPSESEMVAATVVTAMTLPDFVDQVSQDLDQYTALLKAIKAKFDEIDPRIVPDQLFVVSFQNPVLRPATLPTAPLLESPLKGIDIDLNIFQQPSTPKAGEKGAKRRESRLLRLLATQPSSHKSAPSWYSRMQGDKESQRQYLGRLVEGYNVHPIIRAIKDGTYDGPIRTPGRAVETVNVNAKDQQQQQPMSPVSLWRLSNVWRRHLEQELQRLSDSVIRNQLPVPSALKLKTSEMLFKQLASYQCLLGSVIESVGNHEFSLFGQ